MQPNIKFSRFFNGTNWHRNVYAVHWWTHNAFIPIVMSFSPPLSFFHRITNDAREGEMEENMGQVNTMIGNVHFSGIDNRILEIWFMCALCLRHVCASALFVHTRTRPKISLNSFNFCTSLWIHNFFSTLYYQQSHFNFMHSINNICVCMSFLSFFVLFGDWFDLRT